MNEILTGNEFAFPMTSIDGYNQYGLTIRQHFAAMILQGLNTSVWGSIEYLYERQGSDWGIRDRQILASIAVKQADALIAELNKQPQP